MEKNQKKFIPQKIDVPKKENLKFVEMFLVMLVGRNLSPFLNKLTIIKTPLTTHLYLLKVSQDSEDNMDLEIKDLETKAFINDKNFENKFKNIF